MTVKTEKKNSGSLKILLLSTVALLAFSSTLHANDFLGDARAAATLTQAASSSEYTWDYKLAQIRAGAAYARGLNGRGVTIGIFDSGVDSSHVELADRFLGEYDAFSGRWSASGSPTQGHGTFVAGVAAAGLNDVGTLGVANGANIRSYKIISSAGRVDVSDGQLARAVREATATNARVQNNSWNSAAPENRYLTSQSGAYRNALAGGFGQTINAWRDAINRGSVVVFAAGNEGSANPGTFALMPHWFSELKKGWLVSVATDSTGRIAHFSNRCGVASSYCLAAPGSSVISTMVGGMYGVGSGTSFSAPGVSGGVAVLMQMYPYLTGAQIKDILLRTANRTGVYRNAAIYGQGLMDLDLATKPVGNVAVATKNKITAPKKSVNNSKIKPSTTFGRSIRAALRSVEVGVLDEYDRSFIVSGDAFVEDDAVTMKHSFNTEDALRAFGVAETSIIENDEMKASFLYMSGADYTLASDNKERFASSFETRDGYGFGLNSGIAASYQFGAFADGTVSANDFVGASLMANPYLALAADGTAAFVQAPVADHTTVRVGSFTGVRNDGSALRNTVKAPGADAPSVTGFASELRYKAAEGKLTLRGLTGAVEEKDAVLGSASDGAFKLGDATRTFFVGAGLDVKLAKKWTASFDFTAGRSSVDKNGSSLVDTGALTSQAWSAQLVGTDVLKADDKFGFAVSQPLRVTGGHAVIHTPGARDLEGNIGFTSTKVGLAAKGQETDLQGFYSFAPAKDQKFSFGGVVRLQPDHDADAKPEMIGLARYSLTF